MKKYFTMSNFTDALKLRFTKYDMSSNLKKKVACT